MDWIDEANTKLKRKNQLLFDKNLEYMQDLILLFQEQAHVTMALWAFDFAEESIMR